MATQGKREERKWNLIAAQINAIWMNYMKAKIGRKTTAKILQETNWGNCCIDELDMATQGKREERKWNLIAAQINAIWMNYMKAKIGRKTTAKILQETNWGNCCIDELDMATQGKREERKWNLIAAQINAIWMNYMKAKIGRKTTAKILQETNWGNCCIDELDMATQGKREERKWNLIAAQINAIWMNYMKAKIGRKTTAKILQETNWGNCCIDELDMATQGKREERKWNLIAAQINAIWMNYMKAKIGRKTTAKILQETNWGNCCIDELDMATQGKREERKWNLIAAQINAIWMNYMKAKIGRKTAEEKSKCRLWANI